MKITLKECIFSELAGFLTAILLSNEVFPRFPRYDLRILCKTKEHFFPDHVSMAAKNWGILTTAVLKKCLSENQRVSTADFNWGKVFEKYLLESLLVVKSI